MSRARIAWFAIALVGCGDDDSCKSATCGSDCNAAGYASGTCVDNACQCAAAPAPGGTISGTALLFGHDAADPAHDHSGITVSVVGTSLTTTTAADGSYTLADVPQGGYQLAITKPKYLDGNVPSVVAVSTATTIAPTVTLNHGKLVGALTTAPYAPPNEALYSPDRSHVLLEITTDLNPSTTSLVSLASDGSSAVPIHTYAPNTFVTLQPYIAISNDSVVYQDYSQDGGSLWREPSDGSALPSLVIPVPGTFGSQLQLIAVTGKFAFVYVTDTSKTPAYSIVAAHTDGSGTAVVWQQAASQIPFLVRAGDDYLVYAISDNTGTTTAIHAYDPNTGTDTVASLAGFTSLGPVTVTRDKQWALFTGVQAGVSHTLVYHVGATTVAVSTGQSGAPARDQVESMADSSGFVFPDTTTTAGVWFFGTTVTPATNPIQLIPFANNNGTQPIPTHLHGSVVVYSDTADSGNLKIVTVPTPGSLVPTTYTLDGRPNSQTYWQVDAAQTRLDGVWTLFGSPIQLKGVSIPLPVTAAPSVATLGSPQTAIARPTLNGAFFYVHPDTYTLSSFTPPFTGAPAATDVDAPAMTVQSLAQGGVVYHRGDGTWWASNGASKVLVSNTAAGTTTFVGLASWVLFGDDAGTAYASRLDGTVIDEPLIDCTLQTTSQIFSSSGPLGEPQPELVGSAVLAPTTLCNGYVPDPYTVAEANLP